MSTVPPPYQYDPKAARRAAAQQARAVRDAYRAQRDLARQQQRHLRRGSILGPILLVGVGLAALLISTGRWDAFTFTARYARWWPALLVLAGLVLLAEWLYDQYIAQTATPPLRRRVGGGVVTLLILATIFGVTSRTVHDQHDLIVNALSINANNIAELFGDKHDLPPEIIDEAIPTLTPGLTLTIDNPRGDILVTGKSNDGNLHITVNKHVYGSDSTLQTKAEQLTPIYTASPNGLTLSVPTQGSDSADLTLLVPESLALSLTAHRGDVKVTGLKAAVSASAYGDLEFQTITGNVTGRLSRQHSDFAAHDITGNLTLKGDAGDLGLTDISGQTYLEGDFYGDIHLERLNGPLTFQTSKTHFTLAHLAGNLDIDTSNISGSDLVGPINLRVHSRNISFDNLTGDVDLTNSNGTVDLTSSKPGNITVLNSNGAINLTIPDKIGYTISADPGGGSHVTDDFELPLAHNSNTAVAGTVGNAKNRINLQTTHANISLHKGPPAP